jgi:hypothetical protein
VDLDLLNIKRKEWIVLFLTGIEIERAWNSSVLACREGAKVSSQGPLFGKSESCCWRWPEGVEPALQPNTKRGAAVK